MRSAGGGAIVNTGSSFWAPRSPGFAGYSAVKAAIFSFTQSAALEGRPHGIRVNTLIPLAATRQSEAWFTRSGLFDLGQADDRARLSPVWSSRVALYLASPLSRKVTGRAFQVLPGEGIREIAVRGASASPDAASTPRDLDGDLHAVVRSHAGREPGGPHAERARTYTGASSPTADPAVARTPGVTEDSGTRLDGAVALLTGTIHGLGRAVALALAEHGASVVVLRSDDPREEPAGASADDVVAEVRAGGGRALVAHGDATTFPGASTVLADTVAALGRVDILVHAPHPVHRAAVEDLDADDLDREFLRQVKVVLATTRAALGQMEGHDGGRIVNIVFGTPPD
ncbi:MAG: SDR family NAD(P)-dependent oxidoreductase, partial [Acidimicrobiales bacterium]